MGNAIAPVKLKYGRLSIGACLLISKSMSQNVNLMQTVSLSVPVCEG